MTALPDMARPDMARPDIARLDMARIALPRLPFGEPHDCTDANDELTLLSAVYDTLVKRRDGRFLPHLAESWQVAENGRRWSFTLRDDVRFHDGMPCDAVAVAASLARMAREDKGYTLGSPAVWRQYLGNMQIATDGQQLEIRLAEPMADLLDVLVQGFIVAPSIFARLDAGERGIACGTGPYRLVSADETAITMARNDDWFGARPANAGLRIELETAPAARLAGLLAGRYELANSLDPKATMGLTQAGVTLHRFAAPVAIIYLLNAARPALADARVRLALSLAIDRQEIIARVMGGAAEPLHGFVSPHHFGAGSNPADGPDRARARALLAEAGHGSGLVLGLDCPTRLPDEAEALTRELGRQLGEVGIHLDVHVHPEREAYAHMVRRKEIRDLCVFDSSPMSTYRVLYEKIDSRIAGAWWQGYRNTRVEALIDQVRVTIDEAEREALLKEAYGELQRDPPWLTLYNPHRVVALAGDHPGFTLPEDGVIDVSALPALSRSSKGADA